jgi:succinate-semialdehyde dehydrogenase/glutarate-semialdehyde dehydrogenase
MKLQRENLIVNRAIVGGARITESSGRCFPVVNPADGTQITCVPDCGAAEAQAAVEAATRAFGEWKTRTAKERAALLKAWHAALMANQEDLARIVSLEQGKPLAESRAEVAYGASFVEWFAEECKRSYGEIVPEPMRGRKLLVVREPVGVAAAITPWNFPMAMLARKVAPALAAGCAMVAKPAEDTPLSSLANAVLAEEAGIPKGLINVVTASRERTPEVAAAWMDDPRVRKISFTGSTAVGKLLMRQSADTLKRVSLELGGNAPFLVFDDADLDSAVKGAMISKFRNSGQTCVCANRILVQDGIYDAFAEKLAAAASRLKVAAAETGDSEQGPLINARAAEKVEGHVQDALANGARAVLGGKRHQLGGTFFEPTVLTGVTPKMRIANEETFGPVAPLFRFHDEAEGIRLANDTPFGLAAYLYARDVGRIWRVSEALEYGMVSVNEGIFSTEVAPFGGIKESGFGREGARQGLEEYQNVKYVCMGGLA